MKETAIKLHLYVQGAELNENQVHQLLSIITAQAAKAGIPMTFQIHEVEVIDNG
jgi:hypothetical protein